MKSYIPVLSLAGTQCNVCFFTEVGRLGRSSSAAGVRQVGGGDVQRQSSLPAREALNQVTIYSSIIPVLHAIDSINFIHGRFGSER